MKLNQQFLTEKPKKAITYQHSVTYINYFPNTMEPRYNKPLFKEVFSIMNSIPQSI